MDKLIKQLAELEDEVAIKKLLDEYEPTPEPTVYVCDGDLKGYLGKELVIETTDHAEFEAAYVAAIKSGRFLIVRKYIR